MAMAPVQSPNLDLPESAPAAQLPREVSLFAVAQTIAVRRRLLLTIVLAAAAVMTAVAFLLPVLYTAEAIILPPEKETSMVQQFMGPLAGLGGVGAAAGLNFRSPADLYIGILKSRTIADALIARFHLQQVYDRGTLVDTRKYLVRRTDMIAGRDTLIHISVDDRDPKRAADLANGFVAELHAQNSALALTSAAQRRLFFQQQVEKEKDALAEAEMAWKQAQRRSGLMYPSGQAEALIRSDAMLSAEITGRQVALQGLRSYATDANPQVKLVEQELAALRAELAKLKTGEHSSSAFQVAGNRLPEAALQEIRRMRDLRYHEAIFALLARQYEAARIDEAREAQVIQVVDKAVPPDKRSWPPRILLIVGGILLALCGGSFFILAQESGRRSLHDRGGADGA